MDFDPIEAIGGALGRSAYELLRQRLLREVVVPQPAAGAEWSVQVPAGAVWEVLHVAEIFATSAVVATRQPQVVFRNPDAVARVNYSLPSSQGASLTNLFNFDVGLGNTVNGTTVTAPLGTPPLPLPAGWFVRSSTGSLDVGDQYSAISLLVREWSLAAVQSNLDWLMESLRR